MCVVAFFSSSPALCPRALSGMRQPQCHFAEQDGKFCLWSAIAAADVWTDQNPSLSPVRSWLSHWANAPPWKQWRRLQADAEGSTCVRAAFYLCLSRTVLCSYLTHREESWQGENAFRHLCFLYRTQQADRQLSVVCAANPLLWMSLLCEWPWLEVSQCMWQNISDPNLCFWALFYSGLGCFHFLNLRLKTATRTDGICYICFPSLIRSCCPFFNLVDRVKRNSTVSRRNWTLKQWRYCSQGEKLNTACLGKK